LLDELTTELVILNRAEEVGISVSEAELEAAINAVKADYPPGLFEQTLAESAVPLGPWKQRMRSRLLLEKLVQFELAGRITVKPEEVADHYNQHYRGNAGAADSDDRFRRLQETIVADLRRKKLEDAFADWVEGLKARYPVHVNAQQWEGLAEPPAAASAPPAPK
jgi:FKBP-type peptidyl-prolyl cis-trans isomerase (trigger factor)